MDDNSRDRLTLARRFLEPANSTHRQYEALRAFFVEGVPSAEAAARFGYTPGSFRVLVHQFRNDPGRRLLRLAARGRADLRASRQRLREQVVALRKQNLSVHDISRCLAREGRVAQPSGGRRDLEGRGFRETATTARRRAARPTPPRGGRNGGRPSTRPDAPRLPHQVRRPVPVLALARLRRPRRGPRARQGSPGRRWSQPRVPCGRLLALKLFGNARHSHVMSSVLDEGLALFAGLNVVPKRSFLTEYSCRIEPACYPKLMRDWFDAVSRTGLEVGDVVRPRLPHDPLPRRRRAGREALRLQAEPAAEGDVWRSWPRTPTHASSAMPTASCARTSRTTRSSASSTSGSSGPAAFPRN